MKVKLTVCYDGTNYCGWQVQPNGISVAKVVEEAIEKVSKEKVKVVGSGRTDAGVHAKGQVAHFCVKNSTIPVENFFKALNTVLPKDVKVLSSDLADDEFDACRSAKKKTYTYSLYKSQVENPLKERYFCRCNEGVNVEAMKNASELFVGEHDFKGFCASGFSAKTTVRTVYACTVKEEGENIFITVTGNGFLYNMVRMISGALLAVGEGRLKEEQIIKTLKEAKRSFQIKTLSAKGLCLESVEY